MDMTIIDTVNATELAAGDTIMYEGSLEEVLRMEDDGEVITVFLEDSGEVEIHPDLRFDLYAY